jgi:O-antigen ligase
MGHLVSLVYIALCILSPADLIPTLAPYRIQIWVGLVGLITALPNIPVERVRLFLPQTWLLIGLMCAMSFSRLINGWYGGAVTSWYEFGVVAAVYFMIVITCQSMPRLRRVTFVFVLVTIYLIAQGFAAVHWRYRASTLLLRAPSVLGGYTERVRAVGWLGDPNDLAQQLIVAMALVLIAWRKNRTISNFLLVVCPLAILVYGVYLTQSRGGLISLLALIFFVMKDRMNAFGAAVMSTVAFLVMLAVSFGGGRAISLGSGGARLVIWGDGLTMLKEHLLFGVGFSRFTHWSHYTAHNSFVLAIAELGLIGCFFWVGLLVFTLGELTRLIGLPVKDAEDLELHRWAKVMRIAIATFLVSGWFLSRSYIASLYILIGIAVVVCELYRKRNPGFEAGARAAVPQWLRWTAVIEIGGVVLVWVMLRARAF